MNRHFFRRETRETHDRDAVANFSEVGSGSVEFDDSMLCSAVDCMGLEPLTITQVTNENFLVGNQPNERGQIGGNRKAAFVIQAGAGDDGSVNFRLEKRQLHRQSNWAGNPTAG